MSPTINPMLIDNDDTSMRAGGLESKELSANHKRISLTERQDMGTSKNGEPF
jgi:hypothetical protein